MSWKKTGGLNFNESKRAVSDYEGNLYRKLIVNDLSVNNTISIDESVGINLPPNTIALDISKNEQTLLSVGGNYKQTGADLEIFNQNTTVNNNINTRRALVHDISDILQINPYQDYEMSVEIYSSGANPTKILGNLDISGTNINITSDQLKNIGSQSANRTLGYYYNVLGSGTGSSYQSGTFDISSNFIDFSIDGSLNVNNVITLQDKDISSNGLADLYLATGSLTSNKASIETQISKTKTALIHNSLDRLIINDNNDYTGGVQIKGGRYNRNIFLDGNVQIGYCPLTSASTTQVLDQNDNPQTISLYGENLVDNNAYNEAFTARADVSYNLDIAGSCRIRGDLLYVDGDFVVEGSKVILNQETDFISGSIIQVENALLLGFDKDNVLQFNPLNGADIVKGVFSRNNVFVGNPYVPNNILSDERNYGGIYFANTNDNIEHFDDSNNNNDNVRSASQIGIQGIAPIQLQKTDFNYSGIIKRELESIVQGSTTLSKHGSEIVMYNYQYTQNQTFNSTVTNNQQMRNADRIRLYAGEIRFDTNWSTATGTEVGNPSTNSRQYDFLDDSIPSLTRTKMLLTKEGYLGIGENKFYSGSNRTQSGDTISQATAMYYPTHRLDVRGKEGVFLGIMDDSNENFTGFLRFGTESYDTTKFHEISVNYNSDTSSSNAITFNIFNSSNRTEVLRLRGDGRIGVGTNAPKCRLDINSTDALKIPVGTNAQRPSIVEEGQIRFNSETNMYEGYNSTGNGYWQGLGGVIDVDLNTYITAETVPGSDEDQLKFFTSGRTHPDISGSSWDTANDYRSTSRLQMIIDHTYGGMAIGNTYAVDVSNGTYAPPNDGLLVEGNVGIGIDVSNNSNPQSQLDISGNVRIGTSYAGNDSITTDPVNGIIIEGPVGIGTSDPGDGFLLDVSGNVRFQSQITTETDLNVNGTVNLYTMAGIDQVGTIKIGRSDDNTNTIIKRYDTYMERTRPVLDFYSKNPNFKELDGTLEIDQITRKIDTFINV